MVPVNLVRGCLAERLQEFIDVADVVGWLRGVVDSALEPQGAETEEESHHFAELEGVALGGGIVAEAALAFA